MEDGLEGLPSVGVPAVVPRPHLLGVDHVGVRQEVQRVEHVVSARHPQIVRRQHEATPVILRTQQNHNYNTSGEKEKLFYELRKSSVKNVRFYKNIHCKTAAMKMVNSINLRR